MKPFLLLACFFQINHSLGATDTIYHELWDISNLEMIGGHGVAVFGDPLVVSTEIGDAVQFDGEGDRLLVDFNPVMDARAFTIELVFKPDACYPNNTDPRFLHIQDPDDPEAKRVLIELRVDANNQCYMDGFMKTDAGSLALMDETLVHPTGVWQHVAITFKDSILTTFFNGVEELSGTVRYASSIVNTIGKTSLGGRMNDVKYYSGLLKTLKVTHACLGPEDFIFIHDSTTASGAREAVFPVPGEMELYPVPADHQLTLAYSQGHMGPGLGVALYNAAGLMVYSMDGGTGLQDHLKIDTSGFADGIYLLHVRSEGQIMYKRIVVLHQEKRL